MIATLASEVRISEDRKVKFQALLKKLVPLGKDQNEEELQYWENIFDDLTTAEQDDVIINLKEELRSLGNK